MQSAVPRRHRDHVSFAGPPGPNSMSKRIRVFACLLALLFSPHIAGGRDRAYLPPEVEQALARQKIPGTSVSIFVREVGRDEPLVSYNSTVPRNPASTPRTSATTPARSLAWTPARSPVWMRRSSATTPARSPTARRSST